MTPAQRKSLADLVSLLPFSARKSLESLVSEMNGFESDPEDAESGLSESEHEICARIRLALNEAAVQGSLGRREFLKIAGLLMSSGLGAMIFPRSAEAMYNMGAFWKKKRAAAASGGNGGVSANPSTNLWGSSSLDPYWDFVTLLVNFDGANGATAFADESNVGKSFATSGAPSVDTSIYKFSGGSASFDGSSYLTFTSADFNFGSGDFTIEFWMKSASATTSAVFGMYNGSYWPSVCSTTGFLRYMGGGGVSQITTISMTDDVWKHVLISRASGTVVIFENGYLRSYFNDTNDYSSGSATPLEIGRYGQNNSYMFTGKLNDFRIYRGIAKYTGSAPQVGTQVFVPPTAAIGLGSTKDSNWQYCVLACPFENSLKDMAGVRSSVSGAVLATADKKFGASSLYLDGVDDYASFGNTSAYEFGIDDFTVEFFLKPATINTGGAQRTIISKRITASNTGLAIRQINAQIVVVVEGAGINGSTTALTGNWQHVAVCRKGLQWSIFVDGALSGSYTGSITIPVNSAELLIGKDPDTTLRYAGSIDSLRVTKGYARYSSEFTPATSAYPVGKDETTDPFWTYNVLVMSMDSLTDVTGRHSITNVGSVSTSTGTKKKGTASASFNGSNYLAVSNGSNDFNMGSSDFTIEFWSYMTSNGSSQVFVMHHPTTSSGIWSDYSLFLERGYGTNLLWSEVNNTPTNTNRAFNSANVLATNRWQYIALTRQGSTCRIFVDGIVVATFTQSNATFDSAFPLLIGSSSSGGGFYGYMDDLRITKGVARYVQNYTPPGTALSTTGTLATGTLVTSGLVANLDSGESNAFGTVAGTVSFTYTGANQSFAVPPGNTSVVVKLWGAGGGSNAQNAGGKGGAGGYSTGTIAVSTGQSLTVIVGGGGNSNSTGGFGGGGSGGSSAFGGNGGGGGRTAIQIDSVELITAGGGGGGSYDGSGGAGGGSSGVAGVDHGGASGGRGGTSSAGGSAGSTSDATVSTAATAGSAFQGGNGVITNDRGGGGGGGGYFGGGGGGNQAGGGGGSGYTGGTGVTAASTTAGSNQTPPNTGDGDYVAGVGAGANSAGVSGGNGLAVITCQLLQRWKNLVAAPADGVSQAGYDFYFGSSSASESSDPTFYGVVGGKSVNDYLSLDGGDYLSLAGGNTTLVQSLHKDNAKFTIEAVLYHKGTSVYTGICGTASGSVETGAFLYFQFGQLHFRAAKGTSGSFALIASTDETFGPGLYHVACSIDETTGTGFFCVNGRYAKVSSSNTFNATYSSPSTGSASTSFRVGATGNDPSATGTRLYMFRLYNRGLSKTELDQNFNAIRGRFGL